MQIPVAVSDLPDSNIDDIVDIDLDVLLLKTNPLQALQSLQSKLPEVAPQLRRQQHLLCPLCCSGPLAPRSHKIVCNRQSLQSYQMLRGMKWYE